MPLYQMGQVAPNLSGPLGFFGATPASQPTGYTNTYNTTTKTLGSYSSNAQNSAYTGGLLDLLQAARLTDVNTLRVAYENLRVLTENVTQQHNMLVADLKTLGLIA